MMNFDQNTNVLIVGLGLIGGSYARALTKKGYNVSAITRSPASIDYALREGIISSGTTAVSEETVKNADLIVFCLYPKVFVEWIEKYQKYIKSGAIITDVTGVKAPIVYKIQEILRDDVEFIAAHPMAGREVYGVENSDERIFKGANYIVTPTDKNSEQAIEACCTLGTVLGFGNISVTSPEEHDEMIGFLSQLTHCIAISLMTCRDCEHFIKYTGDSFRDLTRISRINEDMWSELFSLNKDALLSQMEIFEKEFSRLKDMLAADDIEGMKEMMRKSTERRKLFDKV